MSYLSEWVDKRFARVKLYEENLWQYQRDAVTFMLENPFSALFLDTGLGKTAACLKVIYELLMRLEPGLTLVIGPGRVVNVTWPDEMAEWNFGAAITWTLIRDEELIDAVNTAGQLARRQARLDGPSSSVLMQAKRAEGKIREAADLGGHDQATTDSLVNKSRDSLIKKEVDEIVKDARSLAARRAVRQLVKRNPAGVHLIHKEMVEFLVDAWGRDWPYKTVFIDESSSLKDHRTNRWKALWKVRPLMTRMHQLTATPASESYLHLYAQITLLDRGKRFGLSQPSFADQYFNFDKYKMKYTLKKGAEDEIVKKISGICLVMKQEDYLDLQKPHFVFHPVYLDDRQMGLYQVMQNEFIVTLPDGSEVEAETAAALSQKLMQMASGVLYETVLEDAGNGDFKKRRVVHHLHDHKIDALRQLQEEVCGESLLVAYYHQSSAERIMQAFPEAREMDKEGKLIAEWNKKKVPMLLLHPQSNAHGLNLQKGGRHVVFFDFPYSYENYYQLWRRLARQGQLFTVVIHHLVAQGTVDEAIVECLQAKCDAQEVLFRMIKALRAKWLSSRYNN